MPIRDLILTSNDPPQALQELKHQWTEMAGVLNDILSSLRKTRDGTLQIGDIRGGNYVSIEPDGSMEFDGTSTVFKDQLGDITTLAVVGVGIAADATEGCITFATGASFSTDYVYSNFQFNHDRKHGAKIYPHVHWWQDRANTPNFLFRYRWQNNGDAQTVSWTTYAMTSNAFTYSAGVINQISFGVGGITPPAGDDVSLILQLQFSRDYNNASGAFTATESYSASVSVLSLDAHYEVDTVGSRQQYVK